MTSRSIKNFFQVASLLMLLVAVALLAAITTMHFAIHGAEVQVPALKGMTVADARGETAGLGLNLDVDNRYYSGDVAAGHILTQSPAAGTVVRREWRVRVSESLGPQKVDVPDTVGSEERLAALELRRAGLEVGTTARLPDGKVPQGIVLAQDPPGHSQDLEQPSINLLVAAPDDEAADGYVMPDIKTAPPKYVNVGVLRVGSGDAQPRLPVKPDSVLVQSPVAGSRVDQSTMVTLTVAK
jgi:beta-lactam-binding protein with PASTA domain